MINMPLWLSFSISVAVILLVAGFWFYKISRLFNNDLKVKEVKDTDDSVKRTGPVFCRNCDHFLKYGNDEEFYKCRRTAKTKKDLTYLVTGKQETPEIEYTFCNVERLYASDNKCGPAGIHFAPKVLGKE